MLESSGVETKFSGQLKKWRKGETKVEPEFIESTQLKGSHNPRFVSKVLQGGDYVPVLQTEVIVRLMLKIH